MDVTIESDELVTRAPVRPLASRVDPVDMVGGVEPAPAGALDQAEVDRELRLVDAAISMVWRRVASRVTLASLELGHAVLAAARVRAALYGLEVRVVPETGTGPIAIVVERAEG